MGDFKESLLLEGFVDRFDGETAYVTLKAPDGTTLHGEYPVSKLIEQGIRERRRFRLYIADLNDADSAMTWEPIPDVEISEERERQINEWIKQALGGDNSPQDDY